LSEGDIDEGIAHYQASPRFSDAEKVALRYSELMALDPDRIDGDFYAALRKHYREEEIVELGAFIGFNIGYHTFFGSLRFYPMFAPDGRLVSQEESARIYGAVPVSLGAHDATPLPVAGESGHSGGSGVSWNPAGAHSEVAGATRPEPVAMKDVHDAELLLLIERGEALGVPTAPFSLVLARSPDHAKTVLRAMLVSHAEGNVDHKLKEIIRVRLARTAGDAYFSKLRSRVARAAGLDEATIEAGAGERIDVSRFSDAEQWALRYARELYLNPEKIDAAFYADGKKHYREAQIMELGAFIALHYGMQAFARTLRLDRMGA
jgi:alkylhydroperoxidase family enzyme